MRHTNCSCLPYSYTTHKTSEIYKQIKAFRITYVCSYFTTVLSEHNIVHNTQFILLLLIWTAKEKQKKTEMMGCENKILANVHNFLVYIMVAGEKNVYLYFWFLFGENHCMVDEGAKSAAGVIIYLCIYLIVSL